MKYPKCTQTPAVKYTPGFLSAINLKSNHVIGYFFRAVGLDRQVSTYIWHDCVSLSVV